VIVGVGVSVDVGVVLGTIIYGADILNPLLKIIPIVYKYIKRGTF
jgi:hypothetical protein